MKKNWFKMLLYLIGPLLIAAVLYWIVNFIIAVSKCNC